MAVLAKGLPVCFVPEQPLIAPVRYDVIHHSRRRQLSCPPAFRAQRIPFQEVFSFSAPPGVISSGVSAAAYTVCAPHDVFTAEYLSRQAEAWASRIAAGSRRSSRHFMHLTSPASACRGNRTHCRRSNSSWLCPAPSPAPQHRPPSRWIFLYPV